MIQIGRGRQGIVFSLIVVRMGLGMNKAEAATRTGTPNTLADAPANYCGNPSRAHAYIYRTAATPIPLTLNITHAINHDREHLRADRRLNRITFLSVRSADTTTACKDYPLHVSDEVSHVLITVLASLTFLV